ncbi:MAG: hypothetical protein AAFR61_29200 [Bacteroidota bacterium]
MKNTISFLVLLAFLGSSVWAQDLVPDPPKKPGKRTSLTIGLRNVGDVSIPNLNYTRVGSLSEFARLGPSFGYQQFFSHFLGAGLRAEGNLVEIIDAAMDEPLPLPEELEVFVGLTVGYLITFGGFSGLVENFDRFSDYVDGQSYWGLIGGARYFIGDRFGLTIEGGKTAIGVNGLSVGVVFRK